MHPEAALWTSVLLDMQRRLRPVRAEAGAEGRDGMKDEWDALPLRLKILYPLAALALVLVVWLTASAYILIGTPQ